MFQIYLWLVNVQNHQVVEPFLCHAGPQPSLDSPHSRKRSLGGGTGHWDCQDNANSFFKFREEEASFGCKLLKFDYQIMKRSGLEIERAKCFRLREKKSSIDISVGENILHHRHVLEEQALVWPIKQQKRRLWNSVGIWQLPEATLLTASKWQAEF